MSFAELLKSNRMRLNLTRSELARKIGISPTMISRYEAGQNLPNAHVLNSLAEFFGVSPKELISAKIESQKNDLVKIEVKNSFDPKYIYFDEQQLQRFGVNKDNVTALKFFGKSMEPAIYNESILLIDELRKEIRDGDIYAIERPNGLFIRAIQYRSDGSFALVPMNKEFPEEIIPCELTPPPIFGKVIWWSSILL